MKLIMGMSTDGYVTREENDDMKWLGKTDKQLFKILTCVGGVLGASKKTLACMPARLPHRTMYAISRDGYSLEQFERDFPQGWLIGGQTLALAALEAGYVDEAYLLISTRLSLPVDVSKATEERLQSSLYKAGLEHHYSTDIVDVEVHYWSKYSVPGNSTGAHRPALGSFLD